MELLNTKLHPKCISASNVSTWIALQHSMKVLKKRTRTTDFSQLFNPPKYRHILFNLIQSIQTGHEFSILFLSFWKIEHSRKILHEFIWRCFFCFVALKISLPHFCYRNNKTLPTQFRLSSWAVRFNYFASTNQSCMISTRFAPFVTRAIIKTDFIVFQFVSLLPDSNRCQGAN